MPNFDRTGPRGLGPITGRRRRYYYYNQTTPTANTGSQTEENKEVVYGLGRGGRPRGGGGLGNRFGGSFGRGFGRGHGQGFGRGQGRGFGRDFDNR